MEAGDPVSAVHGSNGLSKNARKKIAKREAILAARPARRAAERARKKEKKAQQKAKGVRPAPRKLEHGKGVQWNGSIVLDCSFDDLMQDKDIVSLCSQVKYCYSAKRKAHRQPRLICASFSGQLKEQFDKKISDHLNWSARDIEFKGEDLEAVLTAEHSLHTRRRAIYLTADSPNLLTTLEEGTSYILGAIVDHNKYKVCHQCQLPSGFAVRAEIQNLCLERAQKLGIAHAALPIGEFVHGMHSRRVLTVNQVVEIMLYRLESSSWETAFRRAIPQRKFDKETKDLHSSKHSPGLADSDPPMPSQPSD